MLGRKDLSLTPPEAAARVQLVRFPLGTRYIVAWTLRTSMQTTDVTETLDLARAKTDIDHIPVAHRPRLLSDNGPCYVSGDLASYLETHGLGHTRGAPYHPMTQGKIERYHRSMKNVVKLEKYFSPWELVRAIARFVDDYNHRRLTFAPDGTRAPENSNSGSPNCRSLSTVSTGIEYTLDKPSVKTISLPSRRQRGSRPEMADICCRNPGPGSGCTKMPSGVRYTIHRPSGENVWPALDSVTKCLGTRSSTGPSSGCTRMPSLIRSTCVPSADRS